MDKLEYQVVMHRIHEIEQEQLHLIECINDKLDYMIDVQMENMQERMLQLREGKNKLLEYIK